MAEFLRQLGYNPPFFWAVFGGAFLLWIAAAALPHEPAGRPLLRFNTPVFFSTMLLVVMFAGRWPGIFLYRPVNPDEPQFLAGAITMLARGEIWWTDPTTSGPLVVPPLSLPGLACLPINYSSGRVVALLLNWGVVILTYLALRHVHGDRKARVLVLPLACFMVCLIFWDFVPYCSECSPVFLCALAIWLCLTAFQSDGMLCNRGRLTGGGLVLGLLPFSKLQILPLGAAIGLSAVAWVLRQPPAGRKNIRRDLGWLLAGAGAGFALMLLSLWHSGSMKEVYASYLVNNLDYAQDRAMPWASSGYVLRYLTEFSWGFSSFHYGLLLLLAISLGGLRTAAWRPLLLGWSLLIGAYYALLAPGRLYPHYLLFLSLPLPLLVGLQFGYLIRSVSHARRLCAVLWLLFLSAGVGAQVIDRVSDRQALGKLVPAGSPRASIVGFINLAKRPGDTLAVWGRRPEFYVETQLPQATREAHTAGQLNDGPQRDYFRARFLADMHASQPAFFIDAVGPDDYIYHVPAWNGHETFPALKDYIGQEYSMVSKGTSFRVYVRRALMSK